MGLHRFAATQRLPVGLDEAWAFFSDPRNLAAITPPAMGFEILGAPPPATMHPGMLVSYRVRPFLGLPLRWVTEITHVVDGALFVDEQRFGPYRFWQHQHHFRAIEGGVEMRDIVHFDVGFGPLGDLVAMLAVKRRVLEIFAFRRRVLEQRFGRHAARGAARAAGG